MAPLLTDPALDYTLVAVRPRGTGQTEIKSFGFNRLIEQQGKILIGEALNIIQHPNGELKQVALRENQLKDILPKFLHYHTDTAPGSSGSPFVDLHPDRKLRSIYSHKAFDPEESIREDFRIEQERAARLRERMATEGTLTDERLAEAMDLLEAQLPFNCEHVVPQSWFEKKEPMRGDLHHLFACESGCNSFRGNIPYFDFPDFEEAIRDECGKRDANRFEPSAAKGIVARATLYFLLRYPGISASPTMRSGWRLF